MNLPNPEKLSNEELLWVIQNVFTNKDGCPLELKNWYSEIKKEFSKRNVKLEFII